MDTVDTIILDSKDRETSSTSTTDFEIKLPFANKQVRLFKIRKISFPLVQDNVTDSNNTFEIDDAATSIATGQYDINGLITWLTANVAGYTFTFESNRRVKVTNDLAATFKWEPLEASTILGFANATFTGATSYTGTVLPNLLPSKYYTLHSRFITKRQRHHTHHSDNRSDLVMLIDKEQDMGSLLVFRPDDPVIKVVNNTNNDIIDFQVRDDSKNVIDIDNGTVVILFDRIG